MSKGRPVCEKCGLPALVHISDQVPDKGMVVRHYCMHCADEHDRLDAQLPASGDNRLSDAAALFVAGVFVLVLSLFADFLRLGGSSGFGLQQLGGVLVGAVLMLLGAIVRAPTMLVFGAITVGLSVVADMIPVGAAEGFGTNQLAGTILGTVLIGVAVWRAKRSRR